LLCATGSFAATPARLPPGEGKQIVERACASCHALEVVTSKKWSARQWEDSVNAMMARGAPVSKTQAPVAVNYLARNFGLVDRSRVLFVDICSFCHTVERISEQALTREEWREETKGMISEGAPVSDEEYEMLLDYLAKNFGPRSTVEEKESK
jgi:mono/diheme cytochrome c family protein